MPSKCEHGVHIAESDRASGKAWGCGLCYPQGHVVPAKLVPNQTTPTKRAVRHRVETPQWMHIPKFVRLFLWRQKFNKREQFDRWKFIIEHFFLGKMNRTEIARALNCSVATVASLIQHIRRAAANGPRRVGLRQDGRARTHRRPGRPRNRRVPERRKKPVRRIKLKRLGGTVEIPKRPRTLPTTPANAHPEPEFERYED